MGSFKLGLEVGDKIRYLEDDLRWPDENGIERIRVAHGMIGTVVMVSDGSLRQEVRKELGLPPLDVSWAMVEFKNGYQTNIGPRDKFEKVSEEELVPLDPNWKPETPEDYYKKEVLGLEVGDWVVWREERIKVLDEDGEPLVTPGMKGQVIALRDGCPPRLEAAGEPSFPWALVEFENGEVAEVNPEISLRSRCDASSGHIAMLVLLMALTFHQRGRR